MPVNSATSDMASLESWFGRLQVLCLQACVRWCKLRKLGCEGLCSIGSGGFWLHWCKVVMISWLGHVLRPYDGLHVLIMPVSFGTHVPPNPPGTYYIGA